MSNSGVIRRTIGFILAAVVLFGGGYWVAWTPSVGTLIEGMGGIFPLMLAVVAISITIMAIFWPRRFNEWGRRIAIIVALVAAWFGREAIGSVLSNGWSLLLLLGVVVALVLLWLLTAYDVVGKLLHRTNR